MIRPVAAALALAACVTPVRAGVYTPDEPVPFAVRPDGSAAPLPFDRFLVLFTTLANQADSRPEFQRGSPNPDRPKLIARIDELARRRATGLDETLALSAAYLRAGRADDALGLLTPLARGRSPDFRALANLAHVHAQQGEWGEAVRQHTAALLDAEFPAALPGATPDQRKWLHKVEREHYRRWLQVHQQRAREKSPPEAEEVFPLFAVRFVNDGDRYEPGKLAAAERAKLPPDAVAVVQQLLLWAPWDTALYWLLAELYAADGRLREAATILDQSSFSRQYSNRARLMDHRRAVQEAAARLPPETEVAIPDVPAPDATPAHPKPAGDDFLPSKTRWVAVAVAFGLLVVVLIVLQLRALGRRLRDGCGPTG